MEFSNYYTGMLLYCGDNGKFTTVQPTSGFVHPVARVTDMLSSTGGILPSGIPPEFDPHIVAEPIRHIRVKFECLALAQMAGWAQANNNPTVIFEKAVQKEQCSQNPLRKERKYMGD